MSALQQVSYPQASFFPSSAHWEIGKLTASADPDSPNSGLLTRSVLEEWRSRKPAATVFDVLTHSQTEICTTSGLTVIQRSAVRQTVA